MSGKQKSKTLVEARNKIYAYFEDKGFVFEEGSRNYLSEAIKEYSAKHNEVLMKELTLIQNKISKNK